MIRSRYIVVDASNILLESCVKY